VSTRSRRSNGAVYNKTPALFAAPATLNLGSGKSTEIACGFDAASLATPRIEASCSNYRQECEIVPVSAAASQGSLHPGQNMAASTTPMGASISLAPYLRSAARSAGATNPHGTLDE